LQAFNGRLCTKRARQRAGLTFHKNIFICSEGRASVSFTTDVKDELAHIEGACTHCDKATLAALVRIEGTLFVSGPGRYRVELATDSASVGRLTIKLIHTLYNLKTQLTVRRSVLHKTPNYLIEVPTQRGLATALVDMGVINTGGGLEMGIKPELVAKQCCAGAYLRGAFLGSGFISNPKSDFHFEIIVETEQLATGIVELMAKKGIVAKVMHRRSSYMVYLKSGNSILEFLAYTGAHHNACILEEERVVKSVRNDVNRQINAEMANQQKATKAAVEQLYTIRDVLKKHPFDSLPPALQQYIKLRVAHPDATLKELGEFADPPLSKSAMNHRVRRLEQIAKGGKNCQ
jgi:hypothetical protein